MQTLKENSIYEHFLYLEDTANKISACKTKEEAYNYMNEAYLYIKNVTPSFFEGHRLVGGYKYLKYAIILCEKALPKDYIMESTPNYKKDMMDHTIPFNAPIEEKLNWIVFMTRKYLEQKLSEIEKKVNFMNYDLGNYCMASSKKVGELCQTLGLSYDQYVIYPGFSEYPSLYDGYGYHYIDLVFADGKEYLVDATYRQFFTSPYNNLNRIGIIDLSNCSPGIFMTMNEERKELASKILKDGWALMNPENMKNYFDGFAISYRNGLYYQVTENYSYTTPYTNLDYERFIKGFDNQINHESEEVLGRQRTLSPIKEIVFK